MAPRRSRLDATPLPGMPPEQIPASALVRVRLDLPSGSVWDISNALKAARDILVVAPTDQAHVCVTRVPLQDGACFDAGPEAPPAVSGSWPDMAGPLRFSQSPGTTTDEARIVGLVPEETDEWLVTAAGAGAWAVLAESYATDYLAPTVRRVAAGECPLLEAMAGSPDVAAFMLNLVRVSLSYVEREPPPPCPLNDRELTMLKLVVDGVTNKQIARELGLTEQTVKNYFSAIFLKTGTQKRGQAAVLATQYGWL